MDEEDEVDIMSDFNLEGLLNKQDSDMYNGNSLISQPSDLLNCEYSLNSQWLVDKSNSQPECWNNGSCATVSSINDESGWTVNEKNLLQRGIEIFGKSSIRLSQFIGSKTASEVTYYLKNFYVEVPNTQNSFGNLLQSAFEHLPDIWTDNQIPATVEHVISSVPTDLFSPKKVPKKVKINLSPTIDKNEYSPTKKKKNATESKYKLTSPNSKCKFRTKLNIVQRIKPNSTQNKLKKLSLTSTLKQTILKKGANVSKIPIVEEIVTIKKELSDSETETDIEIDVDTEKDKASFKNSVHEKNSAPIIKNVDKKNDNFMDFISKIDLSKLDKYTASKLKSFDRPKCELVVDENFVSTLEKVVHAEYFEKDQDKTPLKYLKIRNHIILKWKRKKPDYLDKYSCEKDLESLYDIEDVDKIHYYLEQMGIINYGCFETNYVRPLYKQLLKNECKSDEEKIQTSSGSRRQISVRNKLKKKFDHNGEGGFTLMHGENGEVIDTTVINEDPAPKTKLYAKKPIVKLIYCRRFSSNSPQNYMIQIHLSALLLMDFHAHSCSTEVMGLVGGHWNKNSKILTINHYEPCRNIASSKTHCDMCPISQAKATDTIHDLDLDILGWFHSHPTFAPEPSQQDLETQKSVQRWLGKGRPCVGIILSPYALKEPFVSSPYRCWIVEENAEEQDVPYMCKVQLMSNTFDVNGFLRRLMELYNFTKSDEGGDSRKSRLEFTTRYTENPVRTYLDKFMASVQTTLNKCNFSNSTCKFLSRGITSICRGEAYF